jgi:hypothetical protein
MVAVLAIVWVFLVNRVKLFWENKS